MTWHLGDALGSLWMTVDAEQGTRATTSYDPWGQPTGPTLSPFGYTGELQAADGAVYLRARWYSPSRGSFGARDPFSGWETVPQSLAPYAYAHNNPVLYTDPSGRCVTWVFGAWNPDPTCQWIGWDRIGRGDLVWEDGRAWGGAALDLLPVVGDLKGLVEVFTGCDLVTGEYLGAWRWAGLLGLSELRQARHMAGPLAAMASHIQLRNPIRLGNIYGSEWWTRNGARILEETVLQQPDGFTCVPTCVQMFNILDENNIEWLRQKARAKNGIELIQLRRYLMKWNIVGSHYNQRDVIFAMKTMQKALDEGKFIITGVHKHAVVVRSVKHRGTTDPKDWIVHVADPYTGHIIELDKNAWTLSTYGHNTFITIPKPIEPSS